MLTLEEIRVKHDDTYSILVQLLAKYPMIRKSDRAAHLDRCSHLVSVMKAWLSHFPEDERNLRNVVLEIAIENITIHRRNLVNRDQITVHGMVFDIPEGTAKANQRMSDKELFDRLEVDGFIDPFVFKELTYRGVITGHETPEEKEAIRERLNRETTF